MTLKAQMAADAAAVFFNTDEFADDIEYVTVDGATISTKAIIDQITDLGPSDWPGGESRVFSVQLLKADVPAPKNGDVFSVPGAETSYRVMTVTQDGRDVLTVQAVAEYRPRGV